MALALFAGGNMSFTAVFYNFSKRLKSTKQPSGGTTYNIELKAPSGFLNPTIKLDIGQSGNPTGFNYCYIAEFNRYYWVSNWMWDNRLWVAVCKVDSMASHKTGIGSYQGYVSRAASSYDGDIMDLYYPAKAEITETKQDATTAPEFTHTITAGCFVIGVQGKDAAPNGGAVTYYAVRPAAIAAITSYLLDPQNYDQDEISDGLLECIFNPMQFIVSCMWFPFALTLGSDSISVGWWTITNTSGACHKLSDPVYTRNIVYPVPKHPQAASRGNYLNMQPFSKYIINAGPWGAIPIDNRQLLDESSLTCVINVDLMTGTGRLSIKGKNSLAYVEDHVAQIGVPVQLGQNMLNQGAVSNAGHGIIGTIGSFISGNPAGALTSGLSAIGNIAAMSQADPISVGSNGSMAFNVLFNIIGRFLTIVDEDLASRGRPLCKRVTISSLSGFIMCEDADPAIAATDSELREIVSNMNSGFYYE